MIAGNPPLPSNEMGVDYFPCSLCKAIICDAGDYSCCDHWYEKFCEDCADNTKSVFSCSKCGRHENDCKCPNGERNIEERCLCSKCVDGHGPSKNSLITFLLEKAGFESRDGAIKAYFESTGVKPMRTVIKEVDGKVAFVEVDRYGSEEDYDFEAPEEDDE